jgi:lysozyme
MGKMLGRSNDEIKHFNGDGVSEEVGSSEKEGAEKVLGQIYDLMIKKREDELKKRGIERNLKEEIDAETEKRDNELIEAVTGEKKVGKKAVSKKAEKPEKPKKPSKLKAAVKKTLNIGASAGLLFAAGSRPPPPEEPTPTAGPAPAPTGGPAPTAGPAPSATPSPPPGKEVKVTPVTGMDDVKKMVKRHEGVRNAPYKDSLGLWTVGVGHLIGDGKSLPPEWNRTLSDKEVNDLFEQDFAHHVKIAEQTPGYQKANDTGKGALIDLAFNMGKWWPKWPTTSKKLGEGDFPGAAQGLQDSKWYTQVGNRAKEIVAMVAQGGSGGSPAKLDSPTPASSSIMASSQQNKDMKDDLKKDQSTNVAKNNNVTNINQTQTASLPNKTDDRSIYLRKTQAA